MRRTWLTLINVHLTTAETSEVETDNVVHVDFGAMAMDQSFARLAA